MGLFILLYIYIRLYTFIRLYNYIKLVIITTDKMNVVLVIVALVLLTYLIACMRYEGMNSGCCAIKYGPDYYYLTGYPKNYWYSNWARLPSYLSNHKAMPEVKGKGANGGQGASGAGANEGKRPITNDNVNRGVGHGGGQKAADKAQ